MEAAQYLTLLICIKGRPYLILYIKDNENHLLALCFSTSTTSVHPLIKS